MILRSLLHGGRRPCQIDGNPGTHDPRGRVYRPHLVYLEWLSFAPVIHEDFCRRRPLLVFGTRHLITPIPRGEGAVWTAIQISNLPGYSPGFYVLIDSIVFRGLIVA